MVVELLDAGALVVELLDVVFFDACLPNNLPIRYNPTGRITHMMKIPIFIKSH